MIHPLLNNYKQYKNIVDDTSQDERISSVLYGVTDFLKSAFGIPILQEDISEVLSVKNHTLLLTYIPKNIISIYVNSSVWDLTNVYNEGNIVKDSINPLPNGKRNAQIEYTIGYLIDSSNNELPYDLQMAIFILTARLLDNANNSAESVDYLSNTLGDKIRVLQNIPSEFYMLINPYRVMRL